MATPEQIQNETMREMLTNLRIDVAVMKDRTDCLPQLYAALEHRVTKNETHVKWMQRGMFGGVPAIGVALTAVMGFLKLTGQQ